MSTETVPVVASHELADILEKLRRGEPRDPEAVRSACEQMDRMREEIRKRVGIVDVAVPAIREVRDR